MQSARLDTALLLFSRSAAGEAVAKPLASDSASSSKAIASRLIGHTRQVVKASGLPFFVIGEHQQHGAHFGERLADAFEQLFRLGYESVIAIGNDCPTLSSKDLRIAAAQLKEVNAVFGPAADGGAYLVGFRREAFCAPAFAALAWQSGDTLRALEEYVAGNFVLLLEKSDVDTEVDLRKAIRCANFPIALKINLLSLLNTSKRQLFPNPIFTWRLLFVPSFSLRGPPLLPAL